MSLACDRDDIDRHFDSTVDALERESQITLWKDNSLSSGLSVPKTRIFSGLFIMKFFSPHCGGAQDKVYDPITMCGGKGTWTAPNFE